MTPLKKRICELIAAQGPISVADYMATCLFDPQNGYYTTREPFGQSGDFTTAPEVSQMFGELIGAWLLSTWQALGEPFPFTLAEIGPGRGTLMKDVLRTVSKIAPRFLENASIALIETSPRLREIQRKTLGALPVDPEWHDALDTLPRQSLLLVGNELFDALPVHQYVKTDAGWCERMVALDEKGDLIFVAGAASLSPALLPPKSGTAPINTLFEVAPARTAIMEKVADHLGEHGGAALFIDYGHLESGFGDTLQALRKHAFDDVFAAPGEADLTSHVDFAALSHVAKARGLNAELTTQGEFLLSLGLLERAGQLGAPLNEAGRNELRDAVERLAAPEQMGELFKALAVTTTGVPLSGFPIRSSRNYVC